MQGAEFSVRILCTGVKFFSYQLKILSIKKRCFGVAKAWSF